MEKYYIAFLLTLWMTAITGTAFAQKDLPEPQIELSFDDEFEGVNKEKQIISELTQNQKKISVLWWNVFKKGLSPKDLNKNLLALITPPYSVDIIVLGEFDSHKTLNPTLLAEIVNHYPYFEYFHYNKNYDGSKDRSILVASRIHPKKRIYEKGGLKWSDPKDDKEEKAKFIESWEAKYEKSTKDWERAFISLTFRVFEKNFSIVPVHLANPWAVVKNVHNYDSFGVTSMVCTGCSVVFGDDNPLSNQIENLQEKVAQQFEHKEVHTVAVFGDFNMPRSVMLKNTSSYNFLVEGMKDTKNNHVTTFPTSQAEEKGCNSPHVEIDHCFCLPRKSSSVQSYSLHLKGSDHYPMLIQIDLK